MIKPRVWFERIFELNTPLEALPDILERLRGSPLRLRERLGHATPNQLRQRHGDKWSMQEHAGHLLDLEALWLARVNDFAAARTTLTATDITNRATWDAAYNERDTESILVEFDARRAALVDAVSSLPTPALRATSLHPRLKQPMTIADHCFFVAEHDDHHLAAITGLLAITT